MVALVAGTVSGCAQQSFSINQETTSLRRKSPITIFSLAESTSLAAQVCGSADKVVRTEVQQTFVNSLRGVVIFGFCTPREARVYYAK